MTLPVVDDIRVAGYTIPTDAPEGDGTLAWNETTLVFVEARAAGETGIGWTYGAAAGVHLITDLLAPLVDGRPAADIPATHVAMSRALRNVGLPGIASTALSAIDIALWDLKAKLLDMPLWSLLGAAREDVPVYGSGGFTTYDDRRLTEQLAGWVHDDDIPRVKIKIGESWGTCEARDLARMRLARKVIGDDAELYVDANGAYGRKQAIRVMEAAREVDVRWYEEPVSSDDLDGLREVRTAVLPDVAAGEYGYDIRYFRRLCAAETVDCLQADATRCGGVTGFLRAAAVAASYSLDVSAHTAPQIHLPLCLAIPNLRHLEWFHDHVRIERTLFDGVREPVHGALRPDPSAPGLGLAFRRGDAERYRVA